MRLKVNTTPGTTELLVKVVGTVAYRNMERSAIDRDRPPYKRSGRTVRARQRTWYLQRGVRVETVSLLTWHAANLPVCLVSHIFTVRAGPLHHKVKSLGWRKCAHGTVRVMLLDLDHRKPHTLSCPVHQPPPTCLPNHRRHSSRCLRAFCAHRYLAASSAPSRPSSQGRKPISPVSTMASISQYSDRQRKQHS